MTDIREKITDILDEYSVNVEDGYSLDYVADAVLAALPDMVPELVWEDPHLGIWRSGTRFKGDHAPYTVFHDVIRNLDRYTSYFGIRGLGQHTTLEAARAAANAHHRATWIAALTGEAKA